MSENMTPSEGSGALSVDGAAEALLGMMDSAEDSQEQPEAPTETEDTAKVPEVETASEDEGEYEDGESDEVEEQEEKPRYKVKVSGEEMEVSLDELINGYQREADYTKKTQSLAEQRRALEAEQSAVQEAKVLREDYIGKLTALEKALSIPPVNLEQLKKTDPQQYAFKVAEKMERDQQLQIVKAERQKQEQMAAQEQQRIMQQTLQLEAQKLAQALPEYADPEKGESIRKEIRSMAKAIGYSDEELSAVYDSRAVLALWKAAQYDKMMSKQPQVAKKVAEAPKMLKSGTSGVRNPTTEQTKKAKQQLKRSGRVADAANVFERFL